MEGNLKEGKEYVIMVLKHKVIKNVRFNKIIEHMMRPDEDVRAREYFLVDLNVYFPLLYFFRLFVFAYGRIYKYL
jgi:hypothetical protein